MQKYLNKMIRLIPDGFYSIAEGINTISLNIFPPLDIKFSSYIESYKKDKEAIKRDWKVVGDDLKTSMKSLNSKLQN